MDKRLKIFTAFDDNLKEIKGIVNNLFRSDRGAITKKEKEITELYNKSFKLLGRMDKFLAEVEKFNKDIEKWKKQ